jgi:parallel beta-helix repeat protein
MSTTRFKTILHVIFIISILLATSLDVKPASASTYTVNSDGDGTDITPGDNVCETATGNGICTLRAAIKEANAHEGVDTITFNIAGALTYRIIYISSTLPTLNEQVTIQGPNLGGASIILDGMDGSTGGFWVAANNCQIRNLTIRNFQRGIVVAGTSSKIISGVLIAGNRIGNFGFAIPGPVGNSIDGIYLRDTLGVVIGGDTSADRNIISGNGGTGILIQDSASTLVVGNYIGTNEGGTSAQGNLGGIDILYGSTGNTIRNNVISGNQYDGISIGGSSNDIFGNYIGTNAAGTVAVPNGRFGILISNLDNIVSDNDIGGTLASQRNLISGNTSTGIKIQGFAQNNRLVNNTIGLDITETAPVPNSEGIQIVEGTENQIGLSSVGSGNVIAGNTNRGISLSGNKVTNTEIRRNWVGLNRSGAAFPNGGHGIDIQGSQLTLVGGSGTGNIIANNIGDGVHLWNYAYFNRIHANSIFDNTELGIDLVGTDEVTVNDPNDTDVGTNLLQNYPIITSAAINDLGQLVIKGYLNSSASRSFYIHFYANETCDPSGFGEGKYYLNYTEVLTADNGYATFTVPLVMAPQYEFVVTTATEIVNNNTSEFSACVTIAEYQVFLPLIIK